MPQHMTRVCALGHLSQRKGNLRSYESLCANVTAVLFIIAPNWKQPRCLSMGEWLNKVWCIPGAGRCLAVERSKLSLHTRWMDPKGFILNEKVSLKRPPTVYFLLYSILQMTELWPWGTDEQLPVLRDGEGLQEGGLR